MRISRQVRQYWPLTIVTVAVALGVPFIASQGDRRPGLTGITGRAAGLAVDSENSDTIEPLDKQVVGYQRPASTLPFYGFDSVSLQAPIFKSWWDGRAAASKLNELGANTVLLDSVWRNGRDFHDTMARLHGAGVKTIVQVTEVSDWVNLRDDVIGSGQGNGPGKLQIMPNTFVVGRAAHVFAQARNQGVGRFADFIILGGNAINFANQQQRQKMYQLAKQYFPTTPIVRRYGLELEKAEAMHGQPHPMGGTWDEYRFGPDECDIALVTVGRGIEEGRAGVRVSAVLEQLNQIVSIVKSRHHDAAIVVTAQLGEDRLLSSTKTAMWSTKEIDQFVSAILTSETIDGLLIKGLGIYAYDLGHPDFGEQRLAFKKAAPVLQVSPVMNERAPASLTSKE